MVTNNSLGSCHPATHLLQVHESPDNRAVSAAHSRLGLWVGRLAATDALIPVVMARCVT
jgi:hypothetical protein